MCYPQVSYFGSSKFLKKITREKYHGINVKINVDFRKNGWSRNSHFSRD